MWDPVQGLGTMKFVGLDNLLFALEEPLVWTSLGNTLWLAVASGVPQHVVAILLALASPEDVTVLGITAVAGNVPLALTEKNARIICELAGKPETRVFAGCDRPLARKLVTAEHVHGKTGLDGPQLAAPTMPLQPQHAVDFLIDTLRAEPAHTVTLCVLGPLTNIAEAFRRAPDIIGRVQQIVLMGGAYFEVGNITPAAEFNIYVDPEAAEIVFKSGVPLVVMPLDVTHKALTSRPWVEGMRALGTPVGQAVASWTDFFERFDTAKYGSEGAPLHDPCVIDVFLSIVRFMQGEAPRPWWDFSKERKATLAKDAPLTLW